MREKAYHWLQAKLVTGQLAPGEALSELALSKELGISRTPLREAIGQLVAEGFLDQIRNRGTVVAQLNRHDVVQLYELREALEVYAVGKLAQRGLRDSDAERAQRVVDELLNIREQLIAAGAPRLEGAPLQRFVAADAAFHTMLLQAAGNSRMLKVVSDTRLMLRIIAIRRLGHTAAELERIHADHRGILGAVRSGQASRATELLGSHIRSSLRERLDVYDEWERQSVLDRDAPTLA